MEVLLRHLLELRNRRTYIQAELAELFGVGRSTIYRTLHPSNAAGVALTTLDLGVLVRRPMTT